MPVFAPGCGAGDGAVDDDVRGLGLALVGPRLITAGVMQSRSMVTEAVYFATAQTGAGMVGQVTNSGTVRITQLGAVYEPSPTDRLVVDLGGSRHEFSAIEAVGDASQMFAANWLAAPHRLSYVHRFEDRAEAHVAETFDGARFVAKITGWTEIAGQRCEVELEARGGTQGGTDFHGADSATRYVLSGKLTAAAFVVDVREEHALRFVSAQSLRLLPSQRGSASQTFSTVNSTLHAAGVDYLFDGVRAESGSKDKGGRSTGGVVALSGRILRDGEPFAECRLEAGLPVAATEAEVLPLVDL
ncbi:MAG: hypothetical protein KDC98_11925 [Planctomycetes bacterium]|nr:hypothetical protein [Planctomycetota bacterium]